MPPNDVVTKPIQASPIVDRFRYLLKEIESQIIENDENDAVSTDDVVRCYEDVLAELTFNSKPIITDLTIIAGDHRLVHARGIAGAVCDRILEVSIEQKMPSLYLLDSIVKNIGREYVRHFAVRLPQVFCETYRQIPPDMYSSMRHLFRTWATVFPSSVLQKIEDELQFSPRMIQPSSSLVGGRASESPRPSHGIHVNPKFMEAQRQIDDPSVKSNPQLARGMPNSKLQGQKPSIGFDEYDFDQGDGVSSRIGSQRYNSTAYGSRTSFQPSANKFLSSVSGPGRPPSPLLDEYAASESPGRTFEQTSPSRPWYGNGGRVRGRDDEAADWQKRPRPDPSRAFENGASYGVTNGLIRDRPRALIDAYGIDERERRVHKKPQRVNRLAVNGKVGKIASQSWKNTDEDEFDWDDMGPTVADFKTSDPSPSSTALGGSSRSGPGLALGSMGKWATSNNLLSREDPQMSVGDSGLIQDNGANIVGYSPMPFSAHGVQSSFPEGRPSQAGDFSASANVPSAVASLGLGSFGASTPLPAAAPLSAGVWPSASSTNIVPLPPQYPSQQQPRSQFDGLHQRYGVPNQGPLQSGNDSNKHLIYAKPTQFQHPGFTPLHYPGRPPVSLHPQMLPSQEQRQNVGSTAVPVPSQPMRPSTSLGYTPLGHGVAPNYVMNNALPSYYPSLPVQNVPNGSVQYQAPVPSHPSGPRPPSPYQMTGPMANQLPNTLAMSSLLSNLVAQGVIPAAVQNSIGEEFNADLLKVRHQSSIRALYEDLPRQCKTCGLRFKTQEEHSKHMDWHVTKNRMSKNRKHNPSRKWFVSTSMWLSSAEALGTDAAPGFLPTETAVEKKDDEELAVPADEDQNTCALCGEPFEDFYSDETEEWMYRGTVYLNVPSGSTAGMDRSQLGPIVHAKCISDSTTGPS